jgi:hypothetical protein
MDTRENSRQIPQYVTLSTPISNGHQSEMETNRQWTPISNGNQSAMDTNQQWTTSKSFPDMNTS